MAGLTDAQLRAADLRGREMLRTEPHASGASFDRDTGRVVVELSNGCTFAFPASFVEDLHEASPEALADVEVDGAGFNLHWRALDVDLSVPALLAVIFGTRQWMTRELARVAGRATSPAKAAAARANGAKGGRPRKTARG